MAGVKGRSGGPRPNSGGARPGAGRKAKPKAAEAPPPAPSKDDDPVEFLIGVMNDLEQEPALRVRAAIAAAQYRNVKLHDGGKKDAAKDAAQKVNKFVPSAAPKLVVNNRG